MLLFHLAIANAKMIVRNRQAIFWAMAFPLVMLVIFGLVARDRAPVSAIGVVDRARDDVSRRLIEDLREFESFNIELRHDADAARRDVARGDLDFLMIIPERLASHVSGPPPTDVSLVYDDSAHGADLVLGSVSSLLDRMNLDPADLRPRITLSAEAVPTRELDFIAFLLPGIAMWGIMSFSVIGVATSIANFREKRILRRMMATPLRVRSFFAAQVLAYLGLALIQAALILGLGSLFYAVPVSGNPLVIGALILFGNLVFLNLGFIVGAFSKSVAAASGLGNVVVLPLLMLSGVFFPPDVLPDVVASIVRYLPLAPLVEALRGVTLEAKGLADFPLELAITAAWIGLTSLVAVKVFKFQ